jgi:hypothetical protein
VTGLRVFTSAFFLILVLDSQAGKALPGASFPTQGRPSDLIQETSFILARQGLTQLDLPLATLKATAMVEDMSGACSSAYISDEGHMLLASHCLETCYSMHQSWSLLSIFEWGDLCEANVGGRHVQARVVAMLKCPFWSNFYARAGNGVQNASFGASGCDGGGDLAVIQLKSPPPPDFRCLPLKMEVPEPGTDVFTIGRPMASSRTSSDYNSNGKDLYLSTGKVVSSQTCQSHGFRATLLDLIMGHRSILPGTRPLQELGLRRAQEAGMLQTTVDILPGSSGGALINQLGEIVGVASFIMLDDRGRVFNSRRDECSGSTFFEPITHLPATAASWSEDAEDEIANLKCVERRVSFRQELQISSK